MSGPTSSPPTWPTTPSSSYSVSATAGFLNKKLHNACEALVLSDKAIYLSLPDKLSDLWWVCVGNADLLITEESAAKYLEAQQALQADPRAPAPSVPKSNVLLAVVHIPAEDYWLTSDGMWKGPTDAAKMLADVKPSCTGQVPTHEVFSGDYANVLKHLKTILDMACTKGFQQSKGVLVNGLGSNPKIKFWHILFSVSLSVHISAALLTHLLNNIASLNLMKMKRTILWLAPSLTQNLRVSNLLLKSWCTTHIWSTDILPQYTMAGWHMQSDEAQEVLVQMQHTHSANYLKASNMHGKLLWPCHYCKYLQEVLVQVHFTLKHWSITKKKKTPCDTYAANIFLMHVLVPPPTSGPVMLKKWKFLQEDPLMPDISLKKFKAFAASTWVKTFLYLFASYLKI